MKKTFLLLVVVLTSMIANAQFLGGFYHADPDAWIDKEPFFACQNNSVSYYGYGQNLQNIYAVVNGETYSYPYVWEYGKYIVLDESCGFEFSSGDVVALYCGNQYIGQWTYSPSKAWSDVRFRGGKGAGKVLKKAWKYVRKIL